MTDKWNDLIQSLKISNGYQKYLSIALSSPALLNEQDRESLVIWKNLEQLGARIVNLCICDFIFFNITQDTTIYSKYVHKYRSSFPQEFDSTLPQVIEMAKQLNQSTAQNTIVYDYVNVTLSALLYLSGGYTRVYQFLSPVLRSLSQQMSSSEEGVDFKTPLQEWAQAKHLLPQYTNLSESGPDHNKTFQIQVKVGNQSALGVGFSKKFAQQNAAKAFLHKYCGQSASIAKATATNTEYRLPSMIFHPLKGTQEIADCWQIKPVIVEECLRTPSFCNCTFPREEYKSYRYYSALGSAIIEVIIADLVFPSDTSLYVSTDLLKIIRSVYTSTALTEIFNAFHLMSVVKTASSDRSVFEKIRPEISKSLIAGTFLTAKIMNKPIEQLFKLPPRDAILILSGHCSELSVHTSLSDSIAQLTAISEVAGWSLNYSITKTGPDNKPTFQCMAQLTGLNWELSCGSSGNTTTKNTAREEAAQSLMAKLVDLCTVHPLPPAAKNLLSVFFNSTTDKIKSLIYENIFLRAKLDPLMELNCVDSMRKHLTFLLHNHYSVKNEQLYHMAASIRTLDDLDNVDKFFTEFPSLMTQSLQSRILNSTDQLY